MSTVKFATLCDKCGTRSEEYTSWPTCTDCQEDLCTACQVPGSATEDEQHLALCYNCREPAINLHFSNPVCITVEEYEKLQRERGERILRDDTATVSFRLLTQLLRQNEYRYQQIKGDRAEKEKEER